MDIFIQNSGEDSVSRSKKQVFTLLFSSDTGIFTIYDAKSHANGPPTNLFREIFSISRKNL